MRFPAWKQLSYIYLLSNRGMKASDACCISGGGDKCGEEEVVATTDDLPANECPELGQFLLGPSRETTCNCNNMSICKTGQRCLADGKCTPDMCRHDEDCPGENYCHKGSKMCRPRCNSDWKSPNQDDCAAHAEKDYCTMHGTEGEDWNYIMKGSLDVIVNSKFQNAFVCRECGCDDSEEEQLMCDEDQIQSAESCRMYCNNMDNVEYDPDTSFTAGSLDEDENNVTCATCICTSCTIRSLDDCPACSNEHASLNLHQEEGMCPTCVCDSSRQLTLDSSSISKNLLSRHTGQFGMRHHHMNGNRLHNRYYNSARTA
jgi:hypothetical protein